MRKIGFGVFVGFFLFGYSPFLLAGSTKVLDLPAVVALILDNSPELKGAQARIGEAEGNSGEASAHDLPSLNAFSGFTRGDGPVYAFGSILNQRNFTSQDFNLSNLNYPGYVNNIDSNLELDIPIFTAFEVDSAKKASKLGIRLSEAQKEMITQNLRFEAVDAYLSVLLEEAIVQNLSNRIDSARKKIDEARALKKKGLVLGSDFYAAQAIEGALEGSRAEAQKNLENARFQLMSLMESEDEDWSLKGNLPGRLYTIASRKELIQEALSQRAELRSAVLGESIARVLKKKEDLSLLPKVQAFALLDANSSGSGALASDRMLGLEAKLPVADPAFFSRIKKAKAKVMVAQADRAVLEKHIRSEVIEAFERYLGFDTSIPIFAQTLRHAQKSLELVGPLYREGRQSVIEVLRAEQGVAQAQGAYLESAYGVHMSYARILLASGNLGTEEIIKVENHLETQENGK